MHHHHHYCNLHEKHYNAISFLYSCCYSTWRWWQWGWALIVKNGKPMKAHNFDGDGVWNWQLLLPNCCLLHNNTRTPYAFPTWRCQKIQRCHVFGYGGPLKFFKFGWLLGLTTKLYTHRGVTLLNCIDLPSHLSSNFEVHMPLFGSIPKGVSNEQMRPYKPKSSKDSFQLKKQTKMGVLLQLYPCCKLLPFFYNNISNVKTKLI